MSEREYNVTGAVTGIVGLRLAVWVGLSAWFLAGPLGDPNKGGVTGDWSYFAGHFQGAYKSYAEYGEFPQWDPYSCGGIPAVGNVQNNAASPSFLLTLPFGLWPGIRLGWLLLFVLGLEGTYRYARHKGAAGLGAATAAVAYCFSAVSVTPFWNGQPAFLGFLLTPWVFLGFEKGLEDLRWSAIGGLFMAWVFCEGGAIATPMAGVILVLIVAWHTGARMVRPRREAPWHRPLGSFVLLGAVAFGLSAMRALPVLETLLQQPRVWHGTESHGLDHVLHLLFRKSQQIGYAEPSTSYVGLIVLGLFAYAVVLRDRMATPLLVFAAAALVLAMGNDGPLGLYDAVRKLPLLRNLRSPYRYTYFAALFVAVGGGRGLTLIEHQLLAASEALKRRPWFDRWRYARTAVTVIAAAAVVAATGWVAWRSFREGPRFNRGKFLTTFQRPNAPQGDRPFAQSMGSRWSADVYSAADLGNLRCFEEQPFPVSPALRGDLVQEEYLADASAGSVRRVSWSPHRIELEVDLARPATIVVNQNAHRGWRASRGGIIEHQGLLAAAAPGGRYRLVFSFSDPLGNLGFAVSLVTAIVVGWWLVRSTRARRRRRGGEASPPGAG